MDSELRQHAWFARPYVWLGGDLGIQKALANLSLKPDALAPWRSYATFQLWHAKTPTTDATKA